jgi:serine O-acetyltransferase
MSTGDDAGLRAMLRLMRSDVDRTVMECTNGAGARGLRYAAHLIIPSAAAAVIFRLSHWAFCARLTLLAAFIAYLNQRVFGLLIHPASRIGPGLFIPHTSGVVIFATAGPRLSAYPFCLIAPRMFPSWRSDISDHWPVLGSDARIGTQAMILGKVVLGDDVMIGPCAVIEQDVQTGAIVAARRNMRLHLAPTECGQAS